MSRRPEEQRDTKNKLHINPQISLKRNLGTGTFKFKDIFGGFDLLESVRETFGKETGEILEALNVEVFPRVGYMGVSDEDGHIFASQTYLNTGDFWSVYLDAVHELVHVRQFREGRNLFDSKYSYGDRPTEIEAYQVTVKEARKIGLGEEEIFEYLKVPWITKSEHLRLARACGVNLENKASSKKTPPVNKKK